MELLTRTWRDLRRLLGQDAWFSFGVLAVAVTLEFVGRRQAATDVHDLYAMLLLACLGCLVLYRHRLAPLGWVSVLQRLAHQARLFLHRQFAYEIGIDLRGKPPLPRGIPAPSIILLSLLVAGAILLVAFADAVPVGLRSLVIRVWYIGYLGLLVLLWLVLVAAITLAILGPIALIHDAFIIRSEGFSRASRRLEALAMASYFFGFLMAAMYLPPWVPLVICLAAMCVNLATTVIPSNPDVKFIWRYKAPDAPIRAVPWGLWAACLIAFFTLMVVNLVLLSAGSAVLGNVSPTAAPPAGGDNPADSAPAARDIALDVMPITTSLGFTLAWLASGGLAALVIQAVLRRARDPARPSRPRVRISGNCSPGQRRALARYFARQGWKVAWPGGGTSASDVCVQLVDQPVAPGPEGPRWPLQVTLDELLSKEVLRRLARRNEIQLRRKLLAGLERLFKSAARYTFRRGSGVWIAPHLWFIPGLSRDIPEEEVDLERSTLLSGIIGQPYHRVFPRCVRHHLWEMLRALQVDMIFVEDGVGFRRFSRVLRMMFEHFDIYGGRRRAEEMHFQGVPGIRVVIHEFRLDSPFKSDVYPEPDYENENLGRARILHIFKDRGEQDEPLESPLDFTNVPVSGGAL